MKKIIKKFSRLFGVELTRFSPEKSDAAKIKAIINKNNIDCVLDVGANIGQYAESLREVGFKGKIISFEALESAHNVLLKKSIKDNNWIIAPRVAIGERYGKTKINISKNSYSSSLLPILETHIVSAPDSVYIGEEEVDMKTLNEVVPYYLSGDENIWLKIDTQGYEDKVIAGARNVLDKIKIIQLELSLLPLYEGQLQYRDLIDLICENNFQLCGLFPGYVDNDSGQLYQFEGLFIKNK